ncbi:MAG: hypothetical protein HZB62_00365 [Nitrospirae bacterium]|nr:hypothetical protein [Nitrospirota bacterium]
MKGKYFISGLIVLLTLPLFSCGGGDIGAPGSTGTQETGIVIESVSIQGVPTESDGTPDIDANVHLCSDGKPEAGLFRVTADISILAKRLNESGVAGPPFPASVEQCTVTYLRAVEDPSAPIIPSLTFFPNCIFTEATETTCNVPLIDIQRKNDFWNALVSGKNVPSERPTHYVAKYNCIYKNEFGTGTFPVEYDFWIDDFENCSN